MNQIQLLIGGKDRDASDGATFDRINPVTGEVATRAAAATASSTSSTRAPPGTPPRHPRMTCRRRSASSP